MSSEENDENRAIREAKNTSKRKKKTKLKQ